MPHLNYEQIEIIFILSLRYNKKIIPFPIQLKNEGLTGKFYRLSDATFYEHINTIYKFIKPFLDKKKNVYF